MIGRIIWFTALLVAALLTAALQLDLRTRQAPGLAPAVPAMLRNQAQTAVTREALVKGGAAQALAEARTLIVRRPLPAENLLLLAAAQVKAGQEEAALRTVQIAGRRGWRQPAAQEAMLRLALANGDRPEAARRYAALFLLPATPDELLVKLGPAVFGDGDATARDTLVAIVVGGERWHAGFLRRGSRVMPPAAFAAIAQSSMARGVRFDCKVLKVALGQLALRDKAAAEQLRAAALDRCPAIGA
ncbi:MAG: hypothetical protein ACKO1O_02640 [Erythrobacter sp.]